MIDLNYLNRGQPYKSSIPTKLAKTKTKTIMGSCISKCTPKSHFQVQEEEEEDDRFCNHIQDKLVISTQPPTPITPIPSHNFNKVSPFPSSPSYSTSSASSFSYCTTTTSTTSNTNSNSTISSSISSLSSSASSVSSSSKIDGSFSNEFLWSCYKENPHITRISAIKEAQKPVASSSTLKKHQQQPNPINRGNVCNTNKTTPQKRVRASTSPTLQRQKSFRNDPEKPVISRSLRSPSPSRRFNVSEKNRGVLVMANPPKPCSNVVRPPSPNNNKSSRLMVRPGLKPARETQKRIHRISSKIDEVAVREALAHDLLMECVPEDVDNPLISLDCFIFL